MTSEWPTSTRVRAEPDYGCEQHGLRCQCARCVDRRLDALFFRAAFDVRHAMGAGAVVMLGPEFSVPAWLC